MMVSVVYLSVVLLGILLDTVVQAELVCGDTVYGQTCYGEEAYCCGVDLEFCCYHNYFYSFWWFWFIWFWVILLIVSCSIWICRRRRRQRLAMPQYVIVEPQQTYGTVSSTSVYTSTGPAVPPTAPAYQQKPPPYSPQ